VLEHTIRSWWNLHWAGSAPEAEIRSAAVVVSLTPGDALLLLRDASNAAAARAESSRGRPDDVRGVRRLTKTLRGSQVVLQRPSTWRCVPQCEGVEVVR
jgi:hypothetical protein